MPLVMKGRVCGALVGLLGLLCAAGCERVVGVDVAQGPRRLVVQARLEFVRRNANTLQPQPAQTIKLSTTDAYFSDKAPPSASGATVQVTDDRGVRVSFTESAARGTYVAPATFIVLLGRIYTLTIDFEGDHYTAVDTARAVPELTSLYIADPIPGRFSGIHGVRATISYVDPPQQRNFYLWEQYVDGVFQTGPDSTIKMRVIATDQLFNGLHVTNFQPFEGVNIPLGARVLVRQIAISESTYQYYFALNDVLASDGSPFAVPPSSVQGNIENQTDAKRPALGYFYVSDVSERQLDAAN